MSYVAGKGLPPLNAVSKELSTGLLPCLRNPRTALPIWECGSSAPAFEHAATPPELTLVPPGSTRKAAAEPPHSKNTKAPGWATGAFALLLQICMHLERKLRRNLQAAWTAAAKEGVADPHVSGRGQAERSSGSTVSIDTVLRCVRNEVWQIGVGEIRMVEQIVGFKTKLHVHVFAKGCLFVNGEVELPEMRTAQGIPAE